MFLIKSTKVLLSDITQPSGSENVLWSQVGCLIINWAMFLIRALALKVYILMLRKATKTAKKQARNENTQMFSVSLFNILFFKGTAGGPSLFLLVLPKTRGTCRIRSSSFFPLIRCSQLTHTLPPVSDCLMIMLMLQKQWMKLGGSWKHS